MRFSLLGVLTTQERRDLAPVVLLAVFSALVDALGIFSLFPFLGALTDPTYIEDSALFNKLNELGYGVKWTHTESVQYLGLFSLGIFIVASGTRAANHYVSSNYIEQKRHTLSSRILLRYLEMQYTDRLKESVGDSLKTTLSEVEHFVGSVIRPFTQLLVNSVVIVFVSVLLVSLFAVEAAVMFIIMFAVYSFSYRLVRNKLKNLGEIQVTNNKLRHEKALEALKGYQTIRGDRLIKIFRSRFDAPSTRYADSLAKIIVLRQLPAYAIEIGLFGGIVLLSVYMVGLGEGSSALVQAIGVMGVAAMRLKPSAQSVYMALSNLRYAEPLSKNIKRILSSTRTGNRNECIVSLNDSKIRSITLQNIAHRVEQKLLFQDLTYQFKSGRLVGLQGPSGAGKTTLLNIIKGFTVPTAGKVLAGSSVSNFQDDNRVKYLPQEAFVIDGTVADNINFNFSGETTRQSDIDKLLISVGLQDELTAPNISASEYQVGESGKRLSGGQRQRVSIARSVYEESDVLLLDEPTANLDYYSEQKIIKLLVELKQRDLILVVSSHSQNLLKQCDEIINLNDYCKHS